LGLQRLVKYLVKMNLPKNISMPMFRLMYGEIRIVLINITTIGISFSDLEMSLKVILLLVTTGYTIHKWITIKSKK
jgi:hypothetical protein